MLNPQLTKDNSLSFDNYRSLYAAIEKSLLMKDEEIKKTQDHLISLYNDHLSPESFLEKFVNAESVKKIICCNDHESVVRYHM